MKKKILVVASHPDDEILGCGGTIAKLSKSGNIVKTIILTKGISSRFDSNKNEIIKLQDKLNKSSKAANKVIGVKNLKFFDLPDNQFDNNSLLSLTKVIEKEIKNFKPNIIFTHFINDLNIDHQYTSRAVLTAARPQTKNSVDEILFFEINSSTDYQINSNGLQFMPNYFVDISKTVKLKKKALEIYKSEMKKYPHSRSVKAILNKNISIGNSIGLGSCEAFQIARIIKK
jgi:N-acetylglucosamine malate deacetylase 1|tara:strand:- start:1918 stop:2607 length:690 start_codon:yes stop_codon:yes gene_type:complete